MNHAQKKVLREQFRAASYGEYRRGETMALAKIPVTKAETTAKKLLACISKQREAVNQIYRKRSNELSEQFNFALEFKGLNECLALIKKRRELK